MELDKFTKEELDELFEASFKVKEIMESVLHLAKKGMRKCLK